MKYNVDLQKEKMSERQVRDSIERAFLGKPAFIETPAIPSTCWPLFKTGAKDCSP